MPTKSGILGMIGCALGVQREDARFMEWNDNIRMGIRADKPGTIMTDYHTVQGEIVNAEGKKRGGSNTIVSRRQYLQDASFLVCLQGDKALLGQFWQGLRNPVWPIFLGRRCCVPSRPIYEQLTSEYKCIEDAFEKHPTAKNKEMHTMLCEIEDVDGEYKRKDVFLNLKSREYRSRKVRVFSVNLKAVD
jgi:CRISPR system Cascade subunit CasD